LSRFAELRKATIIFVMSVCLSVRVHGTTRLPLDRFSWNLIFECFLTFSKKIQASLKCDRNNGYFTWRHIYIYDNMSLKFFIMESISDKSCRGRHNTNFVFSNFFPNIVPFMDNVEKHGRDRQATHDNTIRRMRVACYITKATDTHSEYATLVTFPR
jgi:hypothetical protein